MKKLDALTGLRFIAAAMIVYLHSFDSYGLPAPRAALAQGVSLFFILSGFILTYVHPSLPSTRDRLVFISFRIGRIWPAHMAALLLCVPLLGTEIDGPFWSSAFLVHAWIPLREFYFAGDSVSWSVSTEFFFYLSFPLLILSWRSTWPWKLAISAVFSGTMVAICIVAGLPLSSETNVSSVGLLYIHPLSRLIEFVLGMCACLLWRSWLEFLPKTRWDLILFTGLELATLLLVNYLSTIYVKFDGHAKIYLGVFSGVPALIALILLLSYGRGAVSRLLATRPLMFLGEISFSLYLVHQIIIRYRMAQCPGCATPRDPASFVVFCLTSLVFAYALYSIVEVPCRQMVRNAASRTHSVFLNRNVLPGFSSVACASLLAGLWVHSSYTHSRDRARFATLQAGPKDVASGGRCAVDSVKPFNDILYWTSKAATISGWSVDEPSASAPSRVRVRFSSKTADFMYEAERFETPQLAEALNDNRFIKGGWRFEAPLAELPRGAYFINVEQYMDDGWTRCRTQSVLAVNWTSVRLLPLTGPRTS